MTKKKHILGIHGRKCFATGHTIPEGETLHFDHITAYALGGASELDNIAPMCQDHNLQKSTLSLGDFRVKLRLDEFFAGTDRRTVGDMLQYLKDNGDIADFGKAVSLTEGNGTIELGVTAVPLLCGLPI